MSGNTEHEVDGGALARTPLSDVYNTLVETPVNSTLRKSLRDVIRVVAVSLLAGAVPDGLSAREALTRGRDLLALLQGAQF